MQGYIESKAGSGHRVKNRITDSFHSKSIVFNFSRYPALSEAGKSFQKSVTIMNIFDDGCIAFKPDLPPLDIFPVNQWKNITNTYWRYIKASDLTYSASSGTMHLKKTLANYLNLSRNIKCDASQIIIVSGSVQSLYLIGNVLLNPGDAVAIENPTFPNIHAIFKGLRAHIHAVPVDQEGLKVSDLNDITQQNIKLVHTVPSCHYPTGVKMSLKRRLELLKWANENKAIIIENDYEHEVNNYQDFIPSLYSLDTEQRTVFLGTFNRILHPSIRVGYMVVPYYLLNPIEALLKHSHRFVPSSIQVVLSHFIEKNYLYKHIKNVIEIIEERKKIFYETFENCFGSKLSLDPRSTLSLHTLAVLPEGLKDTALAYIFAKNNIRVYEYSRCFVDSNIKQGLILGVAPVRAPIIKENIIKMEQIFREYSKVQLTE